MKILSTTLLLCLLASANCFSQTTKFVLSGGTDDTRLKTNIEQRITTLLCEVNDAHKSGNALKLASLNLTQRAQSSLAMLWENVHFYCEDSQVVERLLQTKNGYQVRGIPLMLSPDDATYKGELYQEAVIDFDRTGREILSFYFAISNNLYASVMKEGLAVEDGRRRQQILDYIEHFRTAYNQKDMPFLRQVYSDDAIIITGNVTQSIKGDSRFSSPKITYSTQSKAQYLANLQRVFNNNKWINVSFSEIKVACHRKKTDFYGVTLRQGYTSSNYSDEGYLFLLWDFTNEDAPQIHVRTWQPYNVPDDEIFEIGDFDL